jgi:redox-sensitive bicupin YhaK (pirin superfamily)
MYYCIQTALRFAALGAAVLAVLPIIVVVDGRLLGVDDFVSLRQAATIVDGLARRDGDGVKLRRYIGEDGHGLNSCLGSTDPFLTFDAYDNWKNDLGGGFPAHPHRGFVEIRYILEGRLQHEDDCGREGAVTDGGLHVFNAGRGAVHEEDAFVSKDTKRFRGFQLWINVPAARKAAREYSSYQTIAAFLVPVVEVRLPRMHNAPPNVRPALLAKVKVLAGNFGGATGPVPANTTGPGFMFLNVGLHRCSRPLMLPIETDDQHVLLHVHSGAVDVIASRITPGMEAPSTRVEAGQLVLLARGDGVATQCRGADQADPGIDGEPVAQFLLITAPRLNEPVYRWQGFAMHTQEALDEARADLKAGRIGQCAP